MYDDVIHPSAKTTGEILNFIPRSIKVLLQGLEKWIINGEESIRLTSKAIEQKIEAIPKDRLIEPEAYIVVPAIQQLGYSYSSEELRELYANLIVSSMDTEKKEQVHPAFVDILKKLTPDEAKIIQYLKGMDSIEYVDIIIRDNQLGGYVTIHKHKTLLCDFVCLSDPLNELMYLENLISLGILTDAADIYRIKDDNYKLIEKRLGLDQLRAKSHFFESQRSFYEVTAFGKSFIETVVV